MFNPKNNRLSRKPSRTNSNPAKAVQEQGFNRRRLNPFFLPPLLLTADAEEMIFAPDENLAL
jgi:hypothetical protein